MLTTSTQLTPDHLRRCGALTRVLMTPLDHASLLDWRRSVTRALRLLLDTDRALSVLPPATDFVVVDDAGGASGDDWATAWRDDFANSAGRGLALSAETRHGLAALWVGQSSEAGESSATASAVFDLLAPAFQAGLDALERLDHGRAAIDATAAPVAVFTADGWELHHSRAWKERLAGDVQASVVTGAARRLAIDLVVVHPCAGSSRGTPDERRARTIVTHAGQYRLEGTLVGGGIFGVRQTVIVTLSTPAGGTLPCAARVRSTLGLTVREAEVALRLATGASRLEIASALGISPHTARTHEEKIFQKLGVRTRAAVARTLLLRAG
jgi:DNA-binding CsgD family transcriptional regulator